MYNTKERLNFSHLFSLNTSNISDTPSEPSLYMICKKDKTGQNQVIFANLAENLKGELEKHLSSFQNPCGLYFCYIPTSPQKLFNTPATPLYHRSAFA